MKYKLADPIINAHQLDAVKEVLLSKQLVQGVQCQKFEEVLGNYLGVESECVAVTSSCTASLHLALLALGIKPGEGVMLPNFTFPATVNAVEVVGATPIFVDVDLEYYVMDVKHLETTYEKMKDVLPIKAIIVVHEFGAAANMDAISAFAKKSGLLVIEDAACAFGSSYKGEKLGLLSDIGCYSFHPRKALTTGEGGALVSHNKQLIETCKILRNHGMQKVDGKIDFVAPGLNYRMTNFQAVLGIEQLGHFDAWVAQRILLQEIYKKDIISPKVKHPENQAGHTWQSYMMVIDESVDRDQLISKLAEQGIESNYGAYAVLSTRYYKDKYVSMYDTDFENSERLFKQGLCLPLHQSLTVEDVKYIAKVFSAMLEA